MTENDKKKITEFRPRLTYKLAFFLDGLPKTTNGSHGHWRVAAAERKKWRTVVKLKSSPLAPCAPLISAKVTLTRYSSSQPDFDNLVISFKSCVDGLKDAGIISDDNDGVLLERSYLWEKVSPKKGRVGIMVEELL